MRAVLHELLKQPETVEEITGLINKIDRDAVRLFVKKFGSLVLNGVMFALGVVVTILITKALGH